MINFIIFFFFKLSLILEHLSDEYIIMIFRNWHQILEKTSNKDAVFINRMRGRPCWWSVETQWHDPGMRLVVERTFFEKYFTSTSQVSENKQFIWRNLYLHYTCLLSIPFTSTLTTFFSAFFSTTFFCVTIFFSVDIFLFVSTFFVSGGVGDINTRNSFPSWI